MDGVKWNLQQMKNKNLIRRVGPDKGGHWEVIDKDLTYIFIWRGR
ncbi:MAG: hypothetical protein MJZ86_06785 [Bacteroidales bacterium]|nr:hypothetical protein [Bacteroidales bacterium]